jgi:peptide/nickel transport system substrate-binding protein
LKQVNTQWPYTLATELSFIGSPTAIKARGAGFASKPVGAGPYLLDSWVRNIETVFVRNDGYYGTRPYFDKVVVDVIGDDAQRKNAFATGSFDAFWTTNSSDAQSFKADATVVATPGIGGRALIMNRAKVPFDDPNVRQAIALAISSPQMAANSPEKNAPLATFFPKGSALYDPSLKLPTQHLAQAQKLIDGYRAAHGGAPLSLDFMYLTPFNDIQGQTLQVQLQQLKGVTVKLIPLAGAGYTAALNAREYAFTSISILGTTPEPALYDAFHTGGQRNFNGYSNPIVDAALEKARTTTSPDAQAVEYKRVAVQIMKDNVYLGTEERTAYNVVKKSAVVRPESVFYAGTLNVAAITLKGK